MSDTILFAEILASMPRRFRVALIEQLEEVVAARSIADAQYRRRSCVFERDAAIRAALEFYRDFAPTTAAKTLASDLRRLHELEYRLRAEPAANSSHKRKLLWLVLDLNNGAPLAWRRIYEISSVCSD